MTEETIQQRLTTILCDQLGCEEADVTPQKTFVELGADSLDFVEIRIAIQEELEIHIEDVDVENCTKVQQLLDLIARLAPEARP